MAGSGLQAHASCQYNNTPMTRFLRLLARGRSVMLVAASAGCAATTPVGPTATASVIPSQSDVRRVADGVDRVLADVFQAVATALAEGGTNVTFRVSSPCSSQGTTRAVGGWSGSLSERDGSGILQLDVRIAFAEQMGSPCVEAGARLAGTLSLKGQIVFAGGRPGNSTTLQEAGEVTFVLNNVAGALQRQCTHTIEVDTRNVICAGDVSLQYPLGTPVMPSPAC